ncbi:MAG: hypothetical protein AAGM22_30300 [Acidobacteriota bacterium]
MSLRNGVLAMAMASLCIASPSQGLCGDVCEISIRADVISVPLPLEGWLYPENANATVTVVDPPMFGTWSSGVYTPSEDFLIAGGDRIRFDVQSVRAARSRHTVVINLAEGIQQTLSEDFDQIVSVSDLGQAFQVEGASSMSVVTAGSQNKELMVSLNPLAGASGIRKLEPYTFGDGRDSARIIGVVNASPPDAPWQGQTDFTATVLELGDLAYAQLRYTTAGGYQFRAVASSSIDCAPCETPWRTVTPNHDYRLRLSFGRHYAQNPNGTNTYSLEIRYRDLDGSWQAEDELSPLTLAPSAPVLPLNPAFGAFDLSGTGQVFLFIDEAEAYDGLLRPSYLTERVEDFQGGTWDSGLSTVGSVSAGPEPVGIGGVQAQNNEFVGEVEILNSGLDESFWIDSDPTESSTLWAHMRLNTSRLNFPRWSGIVVLRGETTGNLQLVQVRLRTNGASVLQIKAQTRDGSGAFVSTPWVDLGTDEEVDIDLAWDGLNGSMDLWLDGQPAASLDFFAGPYRLDSVSFGVGNVALGAGLIDLSSVLYFDDIALLYR